MVSRTGRNGNGKPKTGHVRKRLSTIKPSPENLRIYRPVDEHDPAIGELARSIQEHGLREAIVVTADNWIVSGHRRHTAARLAGLKTVPCRVLPIRRDDDVDRFVVLLREYNRQRDKSNAEKLREELVTVNPDEAYEALIDFRERQSRIAVETIRLKPRRQRSRISDAKRPMLEACKRIIEAMRPYWPIGERKVHYKLLNDPPLRHAGKPQSRYENTRRCSNDLSDLITRARIIGEIPFEAIGDDTRPMTTWRVHDDPRQFIREQLDGMFKGYWRNLMVSQPNHAETVVEKNTIEGILRPVAAEYTIPITSLRGFTSHAPFYAIQQRFLRSGKERLVLIVASDFDPSGECIAESFCRILRDDYGIEQVVPIKAALTHQQTLELDLPQNIEPKATDSRTQEFVERYGNRCYELEAVDEETLQRLFREAIDSAIDIDAFNAEVEAERLDAAYLDGVRRHVHDTLCGIDF